jgi:hypothetical protein
MKKFMAIISAFVTGSMAVVATNASQLAHAGIMN